MKITALELKGTAEDDKGPYQFSVHLRPDTLASGDQVELIDGFLQALADAEHLLGKF